jgi:autoinducer 2-degrading protein
MHVTIVHVHVRSEHVEDFIAASAANHEGSVREPGNLRFDVLQSTEDPSRFVLYEAYASAEAAAAHKATAHYLAWRDAVGPWMQEARAGVLYRGLLPKVEL